MERVQLSQDDRECRFFIGVALGQRHESTALCMAQETFRRYGEGEVAHFTVRFFERLDAGTGYPEIISRVVKLRDNARGIGACPEIYLDVTGRGSSVVSFCHGNDLYPTPIYFNQGDRREESDDGSIHLGMAWAVARLQVLLQSGWLHLPTSSIFRTVAEELASFQVDMQPDGHERRGGFPIGTNDDYVKALALSVQDHEPPVPFGRVL